eukprot:gene10203-biopygen9314
MWSKIMAHVAPPPCFADDIRFDKGYNKYYVPYTLFEEKFALWIKTAQYSVRKGHLHDYFGNLALGASLRASLHPRHAFVICVRVILLRASWFWQIFCDRGPSTISCEY